jgi:hypothetical protein
MSQKKIPELFKRIPGKILFEQAREDFNVTRRAPLVTTTKCGKCTVLCRRHPVGAKPSVYNQEA